MKKFSFWLVLVVVNIVCIEAMAWLGYRLSFGDYFSYESIRELRQNTIGKVTMETKEVGKAPVYLLHPYYGYTMNPNWIEEYRREVGNTDAGQLLIDDLINAYGFFGNTPPIQKYDPRKFIVGITGGSVAAYAGAWGRQIFIDELKRMPIARDREIVLLNFGQAAYKQPQQVMVISDILSQGGHIDLLINIDGFNEVALPRGHDAFSSGTSTFFPQNWKLSTDTNFSRDAMFALGKMALNQESRLKLTEWSDSFPFRYSVTVGLTWRILDRYLSGQIKALEANLQQGSIARASGAMQTTSDGRTSLGPPDNLKDLRDLYERTAAHWARSSVLLNNLVASQGGLYVHILQPNQYFPGSKPIGAEEAKIALNSGSPYKEEIEQGYPYLRAAGKALRAAKVNFIDLTKLFVDDNEIRYIDACCHFNKKGNEKLVQAINAGLSDTLLTGASPYLATFINPDFSISNLRANVLEPISYKDGTGMPIRKADVK